MTEQQPAVTLSHPPERLLRVANPTVKALMLTPLMGSLRKQLMLLVVTGRKSGQKYSFPLSAHQLDGVYYALTSAPWKNNFRDGAAAILRHAGSTKRVHGELITDPGAVAEISRRCAESYGPKRAQMMMGLKFRDQRRVPSVEEFAEAVSRVGYAAIRLTPTR